MKIFIVLCLALSLFQIHAEIGCTSGGTISEVFTHFQEKTQTIPIASQLTRENLIGGGAEGMVYTITFLGCEFAVKCPPEGQSLTKEFRLLQRFQAPNVLVVYGMINHCIAMELHDMNFAETQLGIDYSIDDIPHFGLKILQAMDSIHAEGYVLNDLKPENLLFTKSTKKLALADFGCVAEEGEESEFSPLYSGLEYEKLRPNDIHSFGQTLLRLYNVSMETLFELRESNFREEFSLALAEDSFNPQTVQSYKQFMSYSAPSEPVQIRNIPVNMLKIITQTTAYHPAKRPTVAKVEQAIHRFISQQPEEEYIQHRMDRTCSELRQELKERNSERITALVRKSPKVNFEEVEIGLQKIVISQHRTFVLLKFYY